MTISSFKGCDKCDGTGYIRIDDGKYGFLRECECMDAWRLERTLRNSGIDYDEYANKTLEKFREDTLISKAMKENAIKFLNDKNATGLGYFGSAGTGKTHICIAVCLELAKRRKLKHKYFSYRAEITRLKALLYNDEAYQERLNGLSEIPVLYIDDLFKFAVGRDGKISNQELQIMFDVINNRYINRKITIFSSEYLVKDLLEIDDALGSRIYEMCGEYGMACQGINRRTGA